MIGLEFSSSTDWYSDGAEKYYIDFSGLKQIVSNNCGGPETEHKLRSASKFLTDKCQVQMIVNSQEVQTNRLLDTRYRSF